MFAWFERRIDPFQVPDNPVPPDGVGRFYLHFIRQIWPLFVGVMVVGFFAAIVAVALFRYLGEIVDLLRETTPAELFSEHGDKLLWMAFVAMIVRPIAFTAHILLVNQAVAPSFTNLIRWQTHRYVLKQSFSFFSGDFAGRIANKIMQTGPSLRESALQVVDAMWFVTIYAASAIVLFAGNDWRLTLPLVLWIAAFVGVLVWFVPRIKDKAVIMSEARSTLTGRIVDSYTNIMTVKLFAHVDREYDYAREAIDDHTRKFQAQVRLISAMEMTIWTINGVLIVSTGALALWLWSGGIITIGAIALTAGLVIRINNMSGWVMWVVTGIFEDIGTVQEGMETISRPYAIVDRDDAGPLQVERGEIRFETVRFHYGKESGVIDNLSLTVEPKEKIGLVGPSGAGKSTLVNVLLRFYDLEGGRILIDGQDIAGVTQDSLRAAIGMVTQDTSLLHRSVRDNIAYGRPNVDEAAIVEAAKRAQAHDFILGLEDQIGRQGYDAHVGERGVKLSGGQRQRVAIARVLLKDAPILVLDEATASLDSEVEAAIQESLAGLMEGKTVIAIAHRLSTIAHMDRIVVLEAGRVVEQGSHAQLLARGGLYAGFWQRQSGGFIGVEAAE